MSVEKIDFQKVVKEEIPYTLVYTKVIQKIHDPLALAMWVYLLSLPQEWKINKQHLKKHFRIGDDKLKNTLAFLHKTNLIEYVRMRTVQGTLGICAINVLCGDKFVNIQEDIECTTTGVKTTRVVFHTCGKHTTYKRNKSTKENKEKKRNISCASDDARKSFERFWNVYPRKKNKKRALALWVKLNCHDLAETIINNLGHQILNDAQWQVIQFIPHPTTYLAGERWEDEVVVGKVETRKESGVERALRMCKLN